MAAPPLLAAADLTAAAPPGSETGGAPGVLWGARLRKEPRHANVLLSPSCLAALEQLVWADLCVPVQRSHFAEHVDSP